MNPLLREHIFKLIEPLILQKKLEIAKKAREMKQMEYQEILKNKERVKKSLESLRQSQLKIFLKNTSCFKEIKYGSIHYDGPLKILSVNYGPKEQRTTTFALEHPPISSIKEIASRIIRKKGKIATFICLGCSGSGKTFSIRTGPENLIELLANQFESFTLEVQQYELSKEDSQKLPKSIYLKKYIGQKFSIKSLNSMFFTRTKTSSTSYNIQSTRKPICIMLTPYYEKNQQVAIFDYPGFQPNNTQPGVSSSIIRLNNELRATLEAKVSGKLKIRKKFDFRSNFDIMDQISKQSQITLVLHVSMHPNFQKEELKILTDFSSINIKQRT